MRSDDENNNDTNGDYFNHWDHIECDNAVNRLPTPGYRVTHQPSTAVSKFAVRLDFSLFLATSPLSRAAALSQPFSARPGPQRLQEQPSKMTPASLTRHNGESQRGTRKACCPLGVFYFNDAHSLLTTLTLSSEYEKKTRCNDTQREYDATMPAPFCHCAMRGHEGGPPRPLCGHWRRRWGHN
jgi:hypothetical protein